MFWREQIEVGHMGENKNQVQGLFINLFDIIKGWPFKGDGKQNMVRPFSVLYNIGEFWRTWDLQNPYRWRNTVRRVSQVGLCSEASRAENSSWICKRWVFVKTSSQLVLAPSNVLQCEFPVICTVENVEAVSHDSFPCHPMTPDDASVTFLSLNLLDLRFLSSTLFVGAGSLASGVCSLKTGFHQKLTGPNSCVLEMIR